MTKMRIFKSWFFNIFNKLRRRGEIDFKDPVIGQERIGGPHRERGTVLAILLNTKLVELDIESKPKRIITKGVKIRNKSNEEIWKFIKHQLPPGSLIETPTRMKRNIIFEWQDDRVVYVTEKSYLENK